MMRTQCHQDIFMYSNWYFSGGGGDTQNRGLDEEETCAVTPAWSSLRHSVTQREVARWGGREGERQTDRERQREREIGTLPAGPYNPALEL
jgi:hypothetical protein